MDLLSIDKVVVCFILTFTRCCTNVTVYISRLSLIFNVEIKLSIHCRQKNHPFRGKC